MSVKSMSPCWRLNSSYRLPQLRGALVDPDLDRRERLALFLLDGGEVQLRTCLERWLHRLENVLDRVARSVVHAAREAGVVEEDAPPTRRLARRSCARRAIKPQMISCDSLALGSAYARASDQRLGPQELLTRDRPLIVPVDSRSLDGGT